MAQSNPKTCHKMKIDQESLAMTVYVIRLQMNVEQYLTPYPERKIFFCKKYTRLIKVILNFCRGTKFASNPLIFLAVSNAAQDRWNVFNSNAKAFIQIIGSIQDWSKELHIQLKMQF